MMFTVEVLLDLGDLGYCEAIAYGSVGRDDSGSIQSEVKSVVALIELLPKSYADWNCTHILTPQTRLTLEEKMEAQFEVAEAKGNARTEDWDRDQGA